MLTDTAFKNAHRSEKAKLGKTFKLADEKGLSFCTYPEINLEQARKRRDDARKLIADGIDSSKNRKAVEESKADSDGNSFEKTSAQLT